MGVGHYENFPVASLLCPPALRPAVVALYRFARTADDIADEGDARTEQRLAQLGRYRERLREACVGRVEGGPWPEVFGPLSVHIARHRLPAELLHALLDAFEQDVHNPAYPDRAALLDYCRRSANPVGRLLLHLFGVDDLRALKESDDICSSLQLINFWQDLGRDLQRGRNYLPRDLLRRHGLVTAEPADGLAASGALKRILPDLCGWARGLMLSGSPLVGRLPGRAAWELRAVVQGGLLLLEKIERGGYETMRVRPRIGRTDLPRLAWRVLTMSAT